MLDPEPFSSIAARLHAELNDADAGGVVPHLLSEYVRSAKQMPNSLTYGSVSPALRSIDSQIQSRFGDSILENFHQLALVSLMTAANHDVAKLPSRVRQSYKESFSTICRDITNGTRCSGRFLISDERWTPYWTYLGITSLGIIPAGVRILIPDYVSVTETVAGDLLGRLKPGAENVWIYNIHLHPTPTRTPGIFNRAESERSLWIAAAMLELRGEFVALRGCSWLNDPQLPTVSPRFGFIPSVWKQVGASTQRVGTNETVIHQATQVSSTRKRLYEQGKYLPTDYAVVYPREKLIDWARTLEHSEDLNRRRTNH